MQHATDQNRAKRLIPVAPASFRPIKRILALVDFHLIWNKLAESLLLCSLVRNVFICGILSLTLYPLLILKHCAITMPINGPQIARSKKGSSGGGGEVTHDKWTTKAGNGVTFSIIAGFELIHGRKLFWIQ